MLIMLFVVGIASAAGAFKGNQFEKPAEVAKENFDMHKAFSGASTESYGYAEAFLAITFAFGGFNQANYVLGDIDDPRRKFKPTAISTVGFVSVMYILINIAYMLVVPKHLRYQKGGDTVVSHYFQGIFGKKSASQVLDAIIAFSSLGNIIVQTFTAARVKQEIAKEGILPFSKFFAKNTSFRRNRNMAPGVPETSEDTPVGALLLHWTSALMLILGSIPLVPNDAYKTFVKLYSFTIDALFGFCVGLSLLVLRLNKSSRWSSKSDVNPIVSTSAALVFTIANLFPLVAIWIPDPGTSFITPSLLSIRSGPGAALLPTPPPSSPQPQLTHIHLRFPYGPFDTAVHGARLFWRTHLRRLKYHNPALPISVEHGPGHLGSPMDIRLTFEGTDVDALKAIAKKSESPGAWAEKKRGLGQMRELTKEGWLTEQEKEELARKQSPNWREAPREGMKKELTDDENSEMEAEKQDGEMLAERPAKRTADDDAVVLKEPRPEADVMDGSNPPAPIYTRSVTLGVKNRTASQIWNWFKMRMNCTEVPRSAEDETEFRKLAGMLSRSAVDRRRVKKGVDERKANDEMLRRARGEVEKLRAEA